MSYKDDAQTRVDSEKLLPSKTPDLLKPSNGHSNLLFKLYVIVAMTFLWTGYTLMVRYTRSTTVSANLYFSSTVVFLAECVKLLITLWFLFKDSFYSVRGCISSIKQEFLAKPSELMKMSVPSIAYALQNNLDFIALSNLDAGVYQVTTQLKVVTTAIFMKIFLGRRFSLRRWIAITLLFGGVALVQFNSIHDKPSITIKGKVENHIVGIAAVLCTCATAGFAGVYFEKMLKDGTNTPFWIRNLQMYSCGVIFALFGCMVTDGDTIRTKGFFHGYSKLVDCIVGR